MHPPEVRTGARQLVEAGVSLDQVSRALGVERSTLRVWRAQGWTGGERSICFRCQPEPHQPPDVPAYAHVLGLYLGDGCISALARGVHSLRVACCDAYPVLMDECEDAIRRLRPGPVGRVRSQGCTYVSSSWKHWPCVFPQHGPGRKHERLVRLEPWQEAVVEEHPGRFLRGLFHSDGCRVQNWATSPDRPGVRYEGYSRYSFTNVSPDIRALCCQALDRLDIAHTHPNQRDISVARRGDVALLDEHVGPKSWRLRRPWRHRSGAPGRRWCCRGSRGATRRR